MPQKRNSFGLTTEDDDKNTKNLNLHPQCSIPPSDVIRDLGVLLDCSTGEHRDDSTCLLYRQNMLFRQVRRCLDETCHRILVQVIISRLDYCNSVLSGLPSSTLQPLSS